MTGQKYSSEQKTALYKAWRELWVVENPAKAVPTEEQFWSMSEMFDLDPMDFFGGEEQDGHTEEPDGAPGLLTGRLWL